MRIRERPGEVMTQFAHDGLVVPGARANEVLYGLAAASGEVGDGLGGLALQAREFAVENDLGQLTLFGAEEAGEVAAQEDAQAAEAAANSGGGNLGIGQEGLGLGVLQQ